MIIDKSGGEVILKQNEVKNITRNKLNLQISTKSSQKDFKTFIATFEKSLIDVKEAKNFISLLVNITLRDYFLIV